MYNSHDKLSPDFVLLVSQSGAIVQRHPDGALLTHPMSPSTLRHLLPDDLHEHSLPPASIEFPVEDLLPRPEVQPAFRHRNDHLASHDLPRDMRVGVIFPPCRYADTGSLAHGERVSPAKHHSRDGARIGHR